MKTFKFRAYLTPPQIAAAQQQMRVACAWYNMCIAEKKWAWELEQRSVSRFDLNYKIKHFRRVMPYASEVPASLFNCVGRHAMDAFTGFFSRVKRGDKAGYPKFQRMKDWNYLEYEYKNGCGIKGRRMYFKGIGNVRIRWHRDDFLTNPPYKKIKTVTLKQEAGEWYVMLACEMPALEALPELRAIVGLDVGLHHLLATSDGETVDNPRHYREAQAKLRRLQRKWDRCQAERTASRKIKRDKETGRLLVSNGWYTMRDQVRKQHAKVKRQREWYLNNIVADLYSRYDVVVIEDLQIKNMVRNKHLSKSILDAGWGFFKNRLQQKADELGKVLLLVDPRYTSQTCSECGELFGEKIGLATRWVTCDCGMSLDRDVNAARNIRNRGVQLLDAKRDSIGYERAS